MGEGKENVNDYRVWNETTKDEDVKKISMWTEYYNYYYYHHHHNSDFKFILAY